MRILRNIVIVPKIVPRRLVDIGALGYQKSGLNGPFHSKEDKDVGVDTTGGSPSMDYAEHTRTYQGFLRVTKYVVIVAALILIGMKIFLV